MQTITGYHITEKVYESATSLVYRAHRLSDGQPVILKVLNEMYPSPDRVAWFKHEYQIMHHLHVSGVVGVYDLEMLPFPATWMMVLEDFGGESLTGLGLAGKITLVDLLELAIGITNSLEQVHQQHIIHKDINPSNIVFNPNTQQVKLIDFGIASVLSRENPTFRKPHVLLGTLQYISPEQTGRMNRAMDYRSDFYSLGVTLYELLTGHVPFQGASMLELVHRHITTEPVPPDDWVSSREHQEHDAALASFLIKAISAIILKLMAKNAEDRYQSAYGLRADLQTCLRSAKRHDYADAHIAVGADAATNTDIADGEHVFVSFTPGRYDSSDQFQIPQKLYGREQEMHILQEAYERVCHGSSEMLLISGYAGVGKTALAQEMYKLVIPSQGYFVSGKFDQLHHNTHYAAFVQAIQSLVRQLLTESQSHIIAWQKQLHTTLGSNIQMLYAFIPEVNLIAGEQSELLDLTPAEMQHQFRSVMQTFIKLFAQPSHPLVLFLDDLQWADGASFKVIESLITDGADTGEHDAHALLLIGTYRDNEVGLEHPLHVMLEAIRQVEETEEQKRVSLLPLKPLQVPDATQLVADTFYCSVEHAQPLAELVVTKTAGNPFFMNEFLHSLYVQGLIHFERLEHARWHWVLEQIQAQEMTDNVVELLANRVQRLTVQTQSVLKPAACIGTRFDMKTLAAVVGHSLRNTAMLLHQAVSEGFIIPLSDTYKLFNVELEGLESLADKLSVEYKFAHDRVQQATYSLLSESDKQATHWHIGHVLLSEAQRADGTLDYDKLSSEHMFDSVNQLNKGREVLKNRHNWYNGTESLPNILSHDELAELNVYAGRKAKASAAYASAFSYVQVSRELLDYAPDPWQRCYDVTLMVYTEATEAAYLSGNFNTMEHLAEIVLEHAHTLLDKVHVHEILIQAHQAQNKPLYALQAGATVLAMLGVELPERPEQADIEREQQHTLTLLNGKPIEDLRHLPPMTDPAILAAMRLLSHMAAPAYQASPMLLPVLVFRMVNLLVTYGNTAEAAFTYAVYGLFQCGFMDNMETGHRFGKLALQLLDYPGTRNSRARTIQVVNCNVRHWKEHVLDTLEPLKDAYYKGLETGDIGFAALAAMCYCFHAYFSGKELDWVAQEMAWYSDALQHIGQTPVEHFQRIYHQAVLNLLGTEHTPYHLYGPVYDEREMLPKHHQAQAQTALFVLYLNKLVLCYLFGAYDKAAECALQAKKYVDAAAGLFLIPVFAFYDSLTLLVRIGMGDVGNDGDMKEHHNVQHAPDTANDDTMLPRERIATNQKNMWQWAQQAPMNYMHKYYLVEAERARVAGRHGDAREYYDQAICLAQKHAYLNEEALANELATHFYLAKGQPKIATTYLLEARQAYRRWGATTKVTQLEQQFVDLLEHNTNGVSVSHTHHKPFTTTITTEQKSIVLDMHSVIEASQAIAHEVVLNALLSKVLRIVMENTGAERGVLLLYKNEQWVVEAERYMDSDEVTLLHAIATDDPKAPPLPLTVINYVARTREQVVLNNILRSKSFLTGQAFSDFQPRLDLHVATQQSDTSPHSSIEHFIPMLQDRYMQAHTPSSLLCMPLLYQDKATGIVYLENKVTTDAFVVERREVLTLLASQAAIAIEHAYLYSHLEDLVNERTAELSRANAELQAARDAAEEAVQAKSLFLANVSHDIRAPLSSIVGTNTLLLDTSLTSEQYDFVETARNSSKALLALVNDILDISKLESGKLELERQPFNLHSNIEQVVDMLIDNADDKDLDVAYHIAPDVPVMIIGDMTRLRQVVTNLLSNAMKFTESGEVVMSVTMQAPINMPDPMPTPDALLDFARLHIAVRDTGIGIPADRINRLFKPYSQADASTTRKYGGTGLGLALCKQIVEMMGGTIWVESEAGKGSTFHVIVDIQHAEQQDSEPAYMPYGMNPHLDEKHVLIVNDGQTSRSIMTDLAREWGMRATPVASYDEALNMLKHGTPLHMAILDIHQTDVDVLSLIKHIRACQAGYMLPLIIYIPKQKWFEVMRSSEAGNSTFLKRPVKPFALQKALVGVCTGEKPVVDTDWKEQGTQQFTTLRSAFAGTLSTLRIMLADDDNANQKVGQLYLERLGCQHIEAVSSGADVIEKLEQQPYDVIFMDVQMAEMDGLEATSHIRANIPKNQQPWIIAMTGRATKEDRAYCLSVGMNDYMAKPIQIEDLAEALHRIPGMHVEHEEEQPETPPDTVEQAQEVDAPPIEPPAAARLDESPPLDPVRLRKFLAAVERGGPKLTNEFIGIFLNNMFERLNAVRQAIIQKNAEDLHKAAHSLKSVSGQIGAMTLSALSKELEIMGKMDTLPEAMNLMPHVEAEYERVRIALNDRMK